MTTSGPAAKESRREGLESSGRDYIRRAVKDLLKERRTIGIDKFYTARAVHEILTERGYSFTLLSVRSRLSEGKKRGELEEGPERVKEGDYMAASTYRWRINTGELPLDFGGVDKSA